MKGDDGIENPAFEPPTPDFGGRRRASPAGAGAAADAPPAQETEEGPCGWGRCTPKALQFCNTPEGYLVAYSLLAIFQGNPSRRASCCPQVFPFPGSALEAVHHHQPPEVPGSDRDAERWGREHRGLDGEADPTVLVIVPDSILFLSFCSLFLSSFFFFLPGGL